MRVNKSLDEARPPARPHACTQACTLSAGLPPSMQIERPCLAECAWAREGNWAPCASPLALLHHSPKRSAPTVTLTLEVALEPILAGSSRSAGVRARPPCCRCCWPCWAPPALALLVVVGLPWRPLPG